MCRFVSSHHADIWPTGAIPPALGELRSLKELNLFGNNLSGKFYVLILKCETRFLGLIVNGGAVEVMSCTLALQCRLHFSTETAGLAGLHAIGSCTELNPREALGIKRIRGKCSRCAAKRVSYAGEDMASQMRQTPCFYFAAMLCYAQVQYHQSWAK